MISARGGARRGRTTNACQGQPGRSQCLAGVDRREAGLARRRRKKEPEKPRVRGGRLPRRQARPGIVQMRLLLSRHWCAAGGRADPSRPSRDITLLEGRGELLRFPSDIRKVAISEPKVADAVVISPREVMVNAKGAGPHHAGHLGDRRRAGALRNLRHQGHGGVGHLHASRCMDTAGGARSAVTGTGDTIVLSGTVKSADGCQAAGRHGADARQERDQSAASAAAARSRARSCCR